MILVFDLSGVFFNNGLKLAVERISEKYNLNPDTVRFVLNGSFAEEYRTGLIKVTDFWKKAKEELNVENIDDVKKIFFDAYEPQQSSIELINKIKEKNIRVAFLSNNPEDRARYLDKKFGFISLFDFGYFSFEAHVRKPNKGIYKKFLENFSLDADEIIYTDDREDNLKPAKELGMKTILFHDISQFKRELKESGIGIRNPQIL